MLLGIDIGTSSCKVILIDSQGNTVASSSTEYPLITPRPGFIEQAPKTIVKAVIKAVSEAIESSRKHLKQNVEIHGISIDSPRDSMIPVDHNCESLHNCITWMDQRSIKQVDELKQELSEDEVRRITGHGIEAAFWIPKILWLKENSPTIFERTRMYLNPASYLLFNLTGLTTIHISAASRTMLIDRENLKWSERMCEIAGINPDMLPPTTKSLETIGETQCTGRDMGLAQGIPVVAANSDDHCTAVGIGTVNMQSFGITAATNDAFYLPVDKPLQVDSRTKGVGCTPHVLQGKWLQHLSISSVGGSLRWFRDNFCQEEIRRARKLGKTAYALMDDLAQRVDQDSNGLLYYPYLWGADVPKFNRYARALFFGIRLDHSKKHFIRAIMEGVALQYFGARAFMDSLGVEFSYASMAGGGANSALWNQMKADALNLPIRIPYILDAAPFGSALIAGAGTGVFTSLERASSELIRWKNVFKPSEENHNHFAKTYEKYDRIYESIEKYMMN
jgi:xylulokinase